MTYSRQNPSPRYLELIKQYREMHESPPQRTKSGKPKEMFRGYSLKPYLNHIEVLIGQTRSKSLLDYGSGKGQLYKDLNLPKKWGINVVCYDPGYKPYATLPTNSFDGVVCTDVLEHIPEDDVTWVLDEIFGFANKFVLMNVSCKPAQKILADGTNAHCTVQPPEWWEKRIKQSNTKNVNLTVYATTDDSDELIIGKPCNR